MANTAKKQTSIPGTEPKSIKEIDTAAEAYVEARDERMKLTEREVEAKQNLIRVMEKHDLSTYRDESADPPLLVIVEESVAKVKVRRESEDDDGGED